MTREDQKRYLEILGLRAGASSREIEDAYRALLDYWNPDRVPEFYKQKAMEGRDQIEEAYQALTDSGKRNGKEVRALTPERKKQETAEQPAKDDSRTFLGKDQNGAMYYLDRKSVVLRNDTVEVEVTIYPPEGSSSLHVAQGYVRRAGYQGLECLAELWKLGISNGVFLRYGQYYKTTCGQLVQAGEVNRKVWRPVVPGTLEEAAWIAVRTMFQKERVA